MRSYMIIAAVLLTALAGLEPVKAFWQSRDSNYNAKIVSGGGGSPTWTPGPATTTAQNPGFGATTTINNVINNGTAIPAGSYACFAFAAQHNASIQPLTYTIGGNAATVIEQDGSQILALICGSIPSSSPDVITVSGANNFGIELFAGGFFSNLSSTTAVALGCLEYTDQNSNTSATFQTTCTGANTSISLPATGIGLVAAYTQTGVAGTSCGVQTWVTTGSSNITSATGDTTACSNTLPNGLSLAHSITATATWAPTVSSVPTYSSNLALAGMTIK